MQDRNTPVTRQIQDRLNPYIRRIQDRHKIDTTATMPCGQRELFIDNLLVGIHFIIVMIRWTALAPWEFEFLFR